MTKVIYALGAAVVVVTPNNPTGSRLRAGDSEWLACLAADRELALISDEVFADYVLHSRADAASFRPAAPVDIAFADPPYAWDAWGDLLRGLRADLAVCEARRAVDPPEGWELVRSDRYGTTVMTLLRSTKGIP